MRLIDIAFVSSGMAKLLALALVLSAAACTSMSAGGDDDGTDPGGSNPGGGDDDGSDHPGTGGGATTGVLITDQFSHIKRYDLAANTMTQVDVDVELQFQIGATDQIIVETLDDSSTGANPDDVTIFFRTTDRELAPGSCRRSRFPISASCAVGSFRLPTAVSSCCRQSSSQIRARRSTSSRCSTAT